MHGGIDQRVAWLLGSTRIHAANPDMAHRDKFVPVLKGLGIAADQGRISRWESGGDRVPNRVIAGYEKVLGLAPGHISAPITGLRRSLDPGSTSTEAVITNPERAHEDLDGLFERIDEAPHGSDWLDLTNYLATHPQIYLRPKSWMQLTDSLISETGRAAGAAYTRRFEAMRTLVRHPGAQRHVMKSIGAFVTDPSAQVVMHPLTLLQEVPHPRAGELAMRLLTTGSGMLQQGAAWVIASKLSRGHFDEEALKQLEAAVLMLLGANSRSLPDIDVLDVAARLPADATQRILLALRETPLQSRYEVLLRTGEIHPPAVTRPLASQVAATAQAATPAPYRIETDMMLQRLVREALFHGHQERRHQAGVMLRVSPYRAGVAAGCADAVDEGDDAVALNAAMLLRYVGSEAEREMLLKLAADSTRPKIRGHALVTLGLLPEGVRPQDEPMVLKGLGADAKRPLKRACLYALGMGGASASALYDLQENDDDFVQRAARWWSETGPAIHESSTAS